MLSLKDKGGICVTSKTKASNGKLVYVTLAEAIRSKGTATAFFGVVALVSSFATSAIAQSVTERLRACLTIEDMTKARLDCYDDIVPPVIEDCRLIKQEDQRLTCFNRFLALPVKPITPEIATVTSKPMAFRGATVSQEE